MAKVSEAAKSGKAKAKSAPVCDWNPRITQRKEQNAWQADWWQPKEGGGYSHKKKQKPTRAELEDWIKTEQKKRKKEAEIIARAERRGDSAVTLANLTPAEKLALVSALQNIRDAGGRAESVADAARIYTQSHLTGAKVTVAALLDEHLKNLEALRKRPPTIRDRRLYLASFVEAYGDRLAASITRQQAEAWIMEADTVSKQASRFRALHALFRFGMRRDYFSKNPVAGIDEPPERPPDRVDIFTPAEAEAVLRAAQEREPRLVAYLAVGMFAGVRPQNELGQMDWSDINLETSKITVTRSTSKTDRVRHVDIQPNLKAWLKSVPKAQRKGRLFFNRRALFRVLGREWPQDKRKAERAAKEARAAKLGHKLPGPKPEAKPKLKGEPLRWSPDIMRHTFCSYRQAVLKDIGKLCFEAGNTPDIATAHYLNPRVSAAEVKAFWNILPTKAARKSKGK